MTRTETNEIKDKVKGASYLVTGVLAVLGLVGVISGLTTPDEVLDFLPINDKI